MGMNIEQAVASAIRYCNLISDGLDGYSDSDISEVTANTVAQFFNGELTLENDLRPFFSDDDYFDFLATL